jgi:hypothetical protein
MRRDRGASLWLRAVFAAVTCAAIASAQEFMPKSGALVAIDTGQTLWIAPVNGKMQVIALDDYVIPRKDGFWRVLLPSKSMPPDVLAVPLAKSKDAIAAEHKASPQTVEGQTEGQDRPDQEAQPDLNEVHRQEVKFLSPIYISVYTETEQTEAYSLLQTTERTGESILVFSDSHLSIPEDVRMKDVKPCIDPENQDVNYQEFASDNESLGIVRTRGRWRYDGAISLRGYSTNCAVSLVPPKSIVAQTDLFPRWKDIKDVYPDADDAFSSPAHDMLLVFYRNRLMVAPVRQGKLGTPLLRLEVNGKPVMVEWALGKYVDVWTKQLTPYFGNYQPKKKTSE